MKTVLFISPHFPPVNAADMHRVRLALPYLRENGWCATVLAVQPEYVEFSKDEMLASGLSDYAEIIRVKALSQKYTRKLGLGNLGIRGLPFLLKEGSRLLKSKTFDLVYFSTTVFDCMTLGRYWYKKFGVKFVVDLQDPWRNDFHLTNGASGRPTKYWFDHRLKSMTEKWTMPYVAGITAVTQQYIDNIKSRYPEMNGVPSLELTFGADERDFRVLGTERVKNPIFEKKEGEINIVYTGAVPEGMAFTLKALFYAMNLDKELANKTKLYFIGTNYARGDLARERVTPYAKEYGMEGIVTEYVPRLPYFQALQAMEDADILLLPGTIDEDYTASKLFPYVLSKKPTLAVFSENSNTSKILSLLNSAALITFNNTDSLEYVGEKIVLTLRAMLLKLPFEPETNWHEFDEYTASTMTRKLTDFFNNVLTNVKS